QVSFGIAEELLRLSVLHGAEGKYPPPACWLGEGTKEERRATRYQLSFNPWLFAIDAEKLLLNDGVNIIYGATAVATDMENGRIAHLVIEGKGGREAIKINKCVVDCSGDCDVAYMSGTPTAEFSQGNKLAAWYYFRDGAKGGKLTMLGVCDDMTVKTKALSGKRYRALGTKEISDMTVDSHASTIADILKRRAGGEDIYPTAIATTPQVRMTRRIVGEYTMHDTEVRKHFENSVGAFSDWRRRGPAYELPFSTLYSRSVKNLLVAGRCISVTDDMWDITRVIPVCAVSGEAAGAAAAMCSDVTSLDVKALQDSLVSSGVKIHI
ncbi:MAG: FAD-dependent oxidoreductase, partial [Clostridia bacterium]|nr:FAD-dependent oxidoreductase [Clostridia bacterium]